MRHLLYFLLVVAMLIISACASGQYKFEYQEQQPDMVWPVEPETPRFKYLGVIKGEANFIKIEGSEGIAAQSLNWFGNLIFGDEIPRYLKRPQSGAYDDENKRLYVADAGAKSLFVFDVNSGTLDVWEGADSSTGFLSPIAVCLLSQNEVFVSDADLGYVIKFDAEGKSLGRVGENVLKRPTGIACDESNNRLYVADSQAHNIHVFSGSGDRLFEFGSKGSKKGEFNSPTHLNFTDGQLYVSDTLNARIQIFDADGQWLSSFGQRGMYVGNLPRPKGVAVDSENHIYVVESYYDHLLIFDEAGKGLLPIGGSGDKPGEFNLPAGLWIDKNDVVYVADMFNSRIVVFQYLKDQSGQVKN